ncbi:enoyl-CoA hydratase-related protein [Oceanicola sp. 502str15]|uniref:enoyl-CoA hydratase-related protein n=1 Tax=Oceanicola sp. 502str15 TaxID=2696061 RepID=UPI0020943F40|nr:enoyl-CoA hydratase-related protein [Oceanicola sp. 502str15]MCO6382705.1 3-hydroxyacyl-CoA dehydrogenase [Oceanicola sp. 502str15]
MASPVKLNVLDGVARIVIDAPPVNAQSIAVRRGLWEAVRMAEADPKVVALAILGAGRNFSAGAEISEFEGPGQEPWFGTVYNRIEACTKPVVAGIAGAALGGGLELALACHFRLAAPGARLGLPEVTLGLVPGAGGTQRTPRLIGAEAALRVMLTGQPMSAKSAEKLGLVDGVVEGDLAETTLALARELGQGGSGGAPRRSRDARAGLEDPQVFEAAIARARAELKADPARARLEAPHRVIDCIEGALLLPFDTGLAYELDAFEELRESRQSAALRHVFFAERSAARPARLGANRPEAPGRIGVVGGGAPGAALAAAAAGAGLDVRLMEQDEAHLEAARARVEALLAGEGRTPEAVGAAMARIAGTGDEGLEGCDLVVETLPDESGLKGDLLARLSELLGAGPVLATLARSPDLSELARPLEHPARFIGLRFFGPVHRAGLLEVGGTEGAGAEALGCGLGLAKALGMQGVLAEPPVAALVSGAGKAAAEEQVARGEASREEINAAWAGFGMGRAFAGVGLADVAGWKRAALIRPGCLAMANAGALMLAQGAVAEAATLDVAMIACGAFPREGGGPMHWAEAEGLAKVEAELLARAESHGAALWEPAPQFAELVKNGQGWGDL